MKVYFGIEAENNNIGWVYNKDKAIACSEITDQEGIDWLTEYATTCIKNDESMASKIDIHRMYSEFDVVKLYKASDEDPVKAVEKLMNEVKLMQLLGDV